MTTLPYALTLYNSVKRGSGFITDITDRALNWKRSIRRVGGFWQASFEYQGNRDELDDLFFDGLMKEVRETSGGVQAWQGFIGDMVYKRGPITWRRSIFDVNNAIKALYTAQFSNLLTNGSAESGAWTPDDVNVTSTQSTAWSSHGTYSNYIEALSGTTHGVTVQSGIAILAETSYSFSIDVKLIANQEVRVRIETDPGGVKLAGVFSPAVAGTYTLTMDIPNTNTYAGNARVRITNNPATQTRIELYADNAILSQDPIPADTGWSIDTASISEFGRLEKIMLEGALNSAAAAAKVATTLQREAWPRLLAPDEFGGDVTDSDSLTVSCYGYVFTLPWAINLSYTEDSASDIVSTLASGRDYVASAQVDTNAMLYTPDNRYQITVWQVLKTLVNSGDASGNLWALGMYADRVLIYEQFSSAIAYRYRDGKLYNPAGGEMEAWLTLPGWASLDDAPLVPYQTATGMDDPRRVIVEEVEFIAPDMLRFRSKVVE